MGATERARGVSAQPTRDAVGRGALAERAAPLLVEAVSLPGADGSRRLRLSGELDLETAPLVPPVANELLGERAGTLVVEAEALHFVDSAGLATLFALEQRFGGLVLLHPQRAVEALISLMGASDVLRSVADYQFATFAGELRSIASARRFAEAFVFEEPKMVVANVALVVSELVTNAVRHAESSFELELSLERGGVRVAVRDFGAGLPARQLPGPEDLAGRGLQIVDSLCRSWGVEPRRVGKLVWALVPRAD